jgi:hypothetical protein
MSSVIKRRNDFIFKQGTTYQPFDFVLIDVDGKTPMDLSGCSVRLTIADNTSIVMDKPMALDDAVNGAISYTLLETDIIVSGSYSMEITVTFPDGKKEIFPDDDYLRLKVSPNLSDRSSGNTPMTQSQYDILSGNYDSLSTDLSNTKISLAQMASKYGYYGNDYATLQDAINDAQTKGKPLVLTDTYTLSGASVKITSPLTIKWNGGKIIQSTWGYPAIEVRSSDVVFQGKCHVENTGTKSTVTTATVSEASSDPKASCTGVLLVNGSHRFKADYIYTKNFVAGVTFLGTPKDDTYIERLEVDSVDFGIFGSGFNNMRIGSILGKNIVKTQNEPEHVVYITGSSTATRNKGLTIDSIQAFNMQPTAIAVSIKSTDDYFIGIITGENISALLNTQWSNGVIDTIKTINTSLTTGTSITVQNNGTRLKINTLDIETLSNDYVVNNTTSAICEILNAYVKITSATPNYVFRNTGSFMRLNKPVVEYTSGQNGKHTIYNTQKILIKEPELVNDDGLVFYNDNAGGTAIHKIIVNPNLYTPKDTSIQSTDEIYHISFVDLQENPRVLVDADTLPSLRGANVLKSNNSVAKQITQFRRGTNNQLFLLINGGNTGVANNANIVLKGGADILSSSGWKVLKFIYLDGIAYEI